MQLNADLNRRAFVHAGKLDWVPCLILGDSAERVEDIARVGQAYTKHVTIKRFANFPSRGSRPAEA